MAVPLEEVIETFDPERRERIKAMADCLLAENQTLKDLRKGKEPPSEQIAKALNMERAMLAHGERMAEVLDIDQGELTKYAHRSDVLLFLLLTYIDAQGGELIVKLPRKRAVTLEKFNEPEDPTAIPARQTSGERSKTAPLGEHRVTVQPTGTPTRQGLSF